MRIMNFGTDPGSAFKQVNSKQYDFIKHETNTEKGGKNKTMVCLTGDI